MKKLQITTVLAAILLLFTSFSMNAQNTKYQLSSHILDITKGMPAPNVMVKLFKQQADNSWKEIAVKKTDDNGRIKDFLPIKNEKGNPGIYKLRFLTAPYFKAENVESFYPFIEVVFQLKGNKHYHVPITLSPFGYSTYRGS